MLRGKKEITKCRTHSSDFFSTQVQAEDQAKKPVLGWVWMARMAWMAWMAWIAGWAGLLLVPASHIHT